MAQSKVAGSEGREKTGCVVGISFGLILILILVAQMFNFRGAELQPETVLSEQFQYDSLPFDLELSAAALLPGGDRLVRLAHPDFKTPEPEPEPEEVSVDVSEGDQGAPADGDEAKGQEQSGGTGIWTPPKIDWEQGTVPIEVFFVFTASPASASKAFNGSQAGGGESSGGGGGGRGRGRGRRTRVGFSGSAGGPGEPIAMDGGDLNWGSSRVGYRHERRFEGESGFDEFRVNLSEAGRFAVLVVRWSENHAGSVARVEELLEAFTRTEPKLLAEQSAL